jgi:hypothetical protein
MLVRILRPQIRPALLLSPAYNNHKRTEDFADLQTAGTAETILFRSYGGEGGSLTHGTTVRVREGR